MGSLFCNLGEGAGDVDAGAGGGAAEAAALGGLELVEVHGQGAVEMGLSADDLSMDLVGGRTRRRRRRSSSRSASAVRPARRVRAAARHRTSAPGFAQERPVSNDVP